VVCFLEKNKQQFSLSLVWRSLVSTEEKNNNGGIAKHSLIYAISNVARQLAGFLMLPIYTSYLSPADYGAVGLLAFALALLEPFFGARLMQAIPKFYFESKTEQSKGAVISSALMLTSSVSAISALMVYIFNKEASDLLFGTTEYALATALFGLNILTQPVEYSGMMFIRIQERSLLYLAISMAKMAVQIGLNLLFVVYLDMGVVGVVMSGVIASTIFGIGLTGYVFYYSKPSFDWAITVKMLIFCWPLWFAGLAGLYIGSSNRLYLRVFSSLDDVGLIELATRFASLLGLLIWGPFVQHWELVSYKYHNEGRPNEVFQSAFLGISTLLIVIGLGISIFSEPVIKLMSSEPFHGAANIVPLLTLGFMLNSIASFFYFSFMVTDRPKLFTYCHYFTAMVITILYFALIPELGVIGAAAGQAVAYAINLLFACYLSRRLLDQGIRLTSVFVMIGVAAVFYVISNISFSHDSFIWDAFLKLVFYLLGVLTVCGISYCSARKINFGNNSLLAFLEAMGRKAYEYFNNRF
jgi:O-antigen/teichoic acid export membrane protein